MILAEVAQTLHSQSALGPRPMRREDQHPKASCQAAAVAAQALVVQVLEVQAPKVQALVAQAPTRCQALAAAPAEAPWQASLEILHELPVLAQLQVAWLEVGARRHLSLARLLQMAHLEHYWRAVAEPMGATPKPADHLEAKELLEAHLEATPEEKYLAWHPTAAAVCRWHQWECSLSWGQCWQKISTRQTKLCWADCHGPARLCQEYLSGSTPLKGPGTRSVATETGQVLSGRTFSCSSLLATEGLR